MSAVAARTPPRRRGGRRLLLVLVVLIAIVGGGVLWLNSSAQAAVNVSATLTVYQPTASVARNGGAYAPATTGAQVQAGDSVKTDTKGRASIQLPDATLTRLASDTEITLDAAHFTKSGNLHDAKITEKIGVAPLLEPGKDPQIAGALGAALFARDRYLAKQSAESAAA